MTDTLFDDVKALLDKDFGDDRILKQIYRACQNNEVISNYERNYVRKLAEQYLGRKPISEEESKPVEEHVVPDVVITPPSQKTQTIQTQSPKVISANQKNTKIMIGIGGVALIAIIAIAISMGGINNVESPTSTTPSISEPVNLSVTTDLPSYDNKDIISISGISNTKGTVNLSIENEDGELVWTEQVTIKNNGRYSTLAIAGGPGWEESGRYTITVDNGVEKQSSTFTFNS